MLNPKSILLTFSLGAVLVLSNCSGYSVRYNQTENYSAPIPKSVQPIFIEVVDKRANTDYKKDIPNFDEQSEGTQNFIRDMYTTAPNRMETVVAEFVKSNQIQIDPASNNKVTITILEFKISHPGQDWKAQIKIESKSGKHIERAEYQAQKYDLSGASDGGTIVSEILSNAIEGIDWSAQFQ